jgi:hypothetical protein
MLPTIKVSTVICIGSCFAAHFVINVSLLWFTFLASLSLSIILMLEQLLLFISVILLVRSLLKVLSLLWFFFEIHVNVLNFLSLWVNQCLVIFQSVLSICHQIGFPFTSNISLFFIASSYAFFRVSCWLIKSSFDPLIP